MRFTDIRTNEEGVVKLFGFLAGTNNSRKRPYSKQDIREQVYVLTNVSAIPNFTELETKIFYRVSVGPLRKDSPVPVEYRDRVFNFLRTIDMPEIPTNNLPPL